MSTDFLLQHSENPVFFGAGNMDIVYDRGGRVVTNSGVEKLRMLVLKAILTGSYTVGNVTFGSTINRLLGIRAPQNMLIEALYATSAEKALNNFRVQQPSITPTDELMVKLVDSVQVKRDSQDPSVVLISAAIENGEGTIITITHSFKTWDQ